jgi:hypothetical protein
VIFVKKLKNESRSWVGGRRKETEMEMEMEMEMDCLADPDKREGR